MAQPGKPQCPHCGKPVSSWQPDALTNPASTQATQQAPELVCNQCGKAAPLNRYNWRKSAAFAASFIEITDIFPREAVPQPNLLSRLQQLSGHEWQHFYACDDKQ